MRQRWSMEMGGVVRFAVTMGLMLVFFVLFLMVLDRFGLLRRHSEC